MFRNVSKIINKKMQKIGTNSIWKKIFRYQNINQRVTEKERQIILPRWKKKRKKKEEILSVPSWVQNVRGGIQRNGY